MKIFTFLAFFLGFASLARADINIEPNPTVGADTGARFGVKSVIFNGSGCVGGKGTGYLVQNDILWLKFADAQTAESGPGTSPSASRRNCSAIINFTDTQKTFTVDSVAFFVEADLPEENTANLSLTWFYAGQGQTGSYNKTLSGAYSGTWVNAFEDKVSPELWKPCGTDRALTVNGAIRVTGPREEQAKAQWQILGIRLKSRSC